MEIEEEPPRYGTLNQQIGRMETLYKGNPNKNGFAYRN